MQAAKGEASDEDEETEYFDAMEDAPAFITVTADPKHHRYELPPPKRQWHGAAWRKLLQCGKSRRETVSSPAGLLCVHVPSKQAALAQGSVLCLSGVSEAEDGPSCSKAGEEGQASSHTVGEPSPPELGGNLGGEVEGHPLSTGWCQESFAFVHLDLLLLLDVDSRGLNHVVGHTTGLAGESRGSVPLGWNTLCRASPPNTHT